MTVSPRLRLVLAGLVLCAACGAPRGPDQSYRAWLDALADGRYDDAWAGLTPDSQAALDAEATRAHAGDGRALLQRRASWNGPGGLPVLGPAAVQHVDIHVESEDSDTAVLNVTSAASTGRVTMRRDTGGAAWRVVLRV